MGAVVLHRTLNNLLTPPPPTHPCACMCLPNLQQQGFYSVHGDAAVTIARDFYRTLAVIKYLGGPPPSGTPGSVGAKAGSSSTPGSSTPAGNSKAGLASVTLNRSLFEGVLRALLLEGGQHSVELWEGAGANWSLAK